MEEKKGGEEDEEITALVEVDETIVEINRMEEEYLKEYEALVDKDKADGKDFNKLRHDIMVDASDTFAYMRKEVKDQIADDFNTKKRSK